MIETQNDYNRRLNFCGCCAMPLCPAPTLQAQNFSVFARLRFAGQEDGIFYSTRILSYQAGGESRRELVPPTYELRRQGGAFLRTVTENVTNTPPIAGSFRTSFEVEVDLEALADEALSAMRDAFEWGDPGTGSGGRGPSLGNLTKTFYRFRFQIPTAHLGNKFRITYDVVESPDDGNQSFFSQNNVIEWSGPGTGSASNPSWFTQWIELDPPDDPGTLRIENIRYTCYGGQKYGVKPQLQGLPFQLPPPP